MRLLAGKLHHHLRAHSRLAVSLVVGAGVALLAPGEQGPVTRALLGWNCAVWLYLVLIYWMMRRSDHAHLRRVAVAQAESAATVLAIVIVVCVVSLLGVVAELTAKRPGVQHELAHLLFAMATVTGAWLLLPTVFTLTYASQFYRAGQGAGRSFPVPTLRSSPTTETSCTSWPTSRYRARTASPCDPEFKKLVDRAIARSMKKGEFSRLYARWFQSPIPPRGANLGMCR